MHANVYEKHLTLETLTNHAVRRLSHVKKTFSGYVARFKKFVDYENTCECQLRNFYKKVFLVKLLIS